MEKKDGGSDGSLTLKADINWLKKEVASLKSMNIIYLWDSLDMPPRVDINVVPEGTIRVDIWVEKTMKEMIYHLPQRPTKIPWKICHTSQNLRS